MKIAVNTRLLIADRPDGISSFTHETMKRLTTWHPEDTFYFLFDRPFDEQFIGSPNIIPVVIGPPARHPLLYLAWFEIGVSLWLRKNKPDLFISPDGCLALSSSTPALLVMHDLNFEHYPRDLPFIWRKYYKIFAPLYSRKASGIATVSLASANDLENTYHISGKKIGVVYSGINEGFYPLPGDSRDEIKKRYSGGKEFFLVVGALHPRKNLVNLLMAFELFRQKTLSEVKLLVIGRKMWETGKLEETHRSIQHREDVIFLGQVSEEVLHELTASALASVFVSRHEGFGLPILEAFHSDTAVITSKVSSMPEVAGNAALLTDPFSVEAISNALEKIAYDPTLREQLIREGRKQRQLFSWDKTAALLWEMVLKIVEENKK